MKMLDKGRKEAVPVVVIVDRIDKFLQLFGIFFFLSKVDNINCNIVSFQPLPKQNELLLISCYRATDKNDDSLMLILVLPMF